MRRTRPRLVISLMFATLIAAVAVSPEARAWQRLAGGPNVDPISGDWTSDCAVVIPTKVIADFLKEQLGGGNTYSYTDFDLGGDDGTSADDDIKVQAERFVAFILAARLKATFRLHPVEPDPSFVQQYECPNQPNPTVYPNIWVTDFDSRTCLLGCPVPAGDSILRCQLQRQLQEAVTLLVTELQSLDVFWSSSNDHMRSTYIQPGRELALRIPGIEVVVFGVRQQLRAPSMRALVEQYGVKVVCENRAEDCRHMVGGGGGTAGVLVQTDEDRDGFCDSTDLCPQTPNWSNSAADSDGDSHSDACDNCPNHWNYYQRDYPDGDLVGNACDDDRDNDGIKNIFDCDEYNPAIGLDADQDGYCDIVDDVNLCSYYCNETPNLGDWTSWIGWAYTMDYIAACYARCGGTVSDNCADATPPGPATTACTETENDMRGGHDTFGASGSTCADLFANTAQEDSNGDGVGDKCESRARSLVFHEWIQTSTSQDELGYYQFDLCGATSNYEVSFTGNAATVAYEGTEAENHLGVSVESCACDTLTSSGQWSSGPLCEDQCPNLDRAPWNPIRATEFGPAGNHPYGDLANQGSIRHNFLVDNRMARDRAFAFKRDPSQNRFSFRWPWRNTVRYPYDSNGIGDFSVAPAADVADLGHTSTAPKGQRVRVSWPLSTRSDSQQVHPDPQDWNVLLSDEVYRFRRPNWCVHFEFESGFSFSRQVALPQVDPAREQAWAIGTDPVTGDHLLAGFRTSLASVQRLEHFEYLPTENYRPYIPTAALTAGTIDASLLGDEPAKIPAIFALDGATLWIGSIHKKGNLWRRAEEALGVTGLPTLQRPQLAYNERGRRLYILGDEPSSGKLPGMRNMFYDVDLATGAVHRLGPLQALRGLQGFSLSFDPVRKALIVFGGQTKTGDSGALRMISLPTLDTQILSDEPDLARRGHAAHFEPAGRILTVYGGAAGDGARTDAAQYSLHTGGWTVLSPEGVSPAGPRIGGFVRYDRRARVLWVAGGIEAAAGDLAAYELRADRGEWTRRVALATTPQAEPGLW